MNILWNHSTRAVFMDTGSAAIFGALTYPAAVSPSVAVNIGNGHTLEALVNENWIKAVFEHHTNLMSHGKLQDYIIRLADVKLSFEDVFKDGGHGAYVMESPGFKQTGFEQVRSLIVTCPRRQMLQERSESELGRIFQINCILPRLLGA